MTQHKDSNGKPIKLGEKYVDSTGETVTVISFTVVNGEEMVIYDWFGYQIEPASIVALWMTVDDYETCCDDEESVPYDWVLAFEARYEQSPRDQFTLHFDQGYWFFNHDYRAIGRDDEIIPIHSIPDIQTDELHETLWKYITKGVKA